MKNLITGIITVLLIPIIIAYLSFSWGYAASVMYKLFVIPVFPDAPSLMWYHFAGIMYFIKCIIHPSMSKAYMKKEYSDTRMGNFVELVHPWFLLGIAWIFKLMMY